MLKQLRFVSGIALVVAAIGYLIISAVNNTAEYYLTVNEVGARRAELSGQMLRVAGRVVPGTIQWDPSSLTLKFAITEPPAEGRSPVVPVASGSLPTGEFTVLSRGQPKPDMFAAGRDVIVEGQLMRNNTIEARQVLTSCPSKYAPKSTTD
jgi:cytochrome c-type biogenesis protein CcmE